MAGAKQSHEGVDNNLYSDVEDSSAANSETLTVSTQSATTIANSRNSFYSLTCLAFCRTCMGDRYRSGRETKENGVKYRWPSYISVMEIFLYLLFVSFWCPTLAELNITAFEYRRKFNRPLSLGECPQREVAVNLGNSSYLIETQRCTLIQQGEVRHEAQEINEPPKNVAIASAEEVVSVLGLCGGEAASYFGVLNSGDCVAVEIGSRLTFTDKTLVRAFVGTYQKYKDTLERTNSNLEGMDFYYKDKYYLRERSYGTMEILVVQFNFESVIDAQEAKKIKLSTPVMSIYMEQIVNKTRRPKSVLVISLSTASMETFQIKQFKRKDWDRAVRHVQIAELEVQRTRNQINIDTTSHHLYYVFHPFLDASDFRLSPPADWEDVSVLQVQLRQTLSLAKKVAKKCRGNRSKLCRRARGLKQKLTSVQNEVHKGRSNWMTMKHEEKSQFAKDYKANVNSYIGITRSLAKRVNEMNRNEKKIWDKEPDFRNEIPTNTEDQIRKHNRRIRRTRGRNKARKYDKS